MKNIYLSFFLLFFTQSHAQIDSLELPKSIIIYDYSISTYSGRFEYEYVLTLKENYYTLEQRSLFEANFKNKNKSKKQSAKKLSQKIPLALIRDLLNEINHPKDSFWIEDLGYSYKWFEENKDYVYNIAKNLWEKRWPGSPEWNQHQIEYIKKQLNSSDIISESIQRCFFNQGYITLHRSSNSLLKLELVFQEQMLVLHSNLNYRGLPWVIFDKKLLYNQKISDIIFQIIPPNKGFNKTRLGNRNQKNILEAIVNQAYEDACEEVVASLSYYNYEKEIAELSTKYTLWGFKEERSATGNWDGEHRIFMFAKDSTEKRNIRLGICLTIEGKTLFTRDSVLKKGDYYLGMVKKVPFLSEYLDEHPERSLNIGFDNGNSLSSKMKKNQSTASWAKDMCLSGASDEYLNRCCAFALRDENNNSSIWLITPELDVILVYYQAPTVYKYTDKDLGLQGPSIRYACKHFNLDGTLKKD